MNSLVIPLLEHVTIVPSEAQARSLSRSAQSQPRNVRSDDRHHDTAQQLDKQHGAWSFMLS